MPTKVTQKIKWASKDGCGHCDQQDKIIKYYGLQKHFQKVKAFDKNWNHTKQGKILENQSVKAGNGKIAGTPTFFCSNQSCVSSGLKGERLLKEMVRINEEALKKQTQSKSPAKKSKPKRKATSKKSKKKSTKKVKKSTKKGKKTTRKTTKRKQTKSKSPAKKSKSKKPITKGKKKGKKNKSKSRRNKLFKR